MAVAGFEPCAVAGLLLVMVNCCVMLPKVNYILSVPALQCTCLCCRSVSSVS